MVVFCCSVCGDSLKKNQVQKHYSRCRMNMVSCMDCSQEFWNDDYQQHIKCISEDEKYSGKDYKPRPGQNKGEAKQDAWLQQVQKAIDNSNPSPKLRSLLERLKDYPNIPRKQAKFLNFLRNSLRVSDHKLSSSVWEILMQATQPKEEANEKENNDNHDDEKDNNREVVEGQSEKNGEGQVDAKKMSKREKKEERRKERTKEEKKDNRKKKIANDDDDEKDVESGRPAKKKGKKRKRNDDYSEDEQQVEAKIKNKSHKIKKNDDDGMPPLEANPNHACHEGSEDEEENNNVCRKKNGLKSKKKSSKDKMQTPAEDYNGMSSLEPNSNHACLEETQEEEEEEDSPQKKKKKEKKKKFNWEQTIFALLKNSKEKSMSEKKLRKKVLAEYMDQDGHIDSMSILKAKFDRKINKNRQLLRQKDKVCLRDE